jgi:8-oxo-dGTP pyrophosphatase MutT (NUDIX family)
MNGWHPHVTVAAVARDHDRFLLVEEWSGGRLVWNQPAGHLERGESLLDAVRREALEETGMEFEPRALVGVYRWQDVDSGITYLRFAFAGDVTGPVADGPLDGAIERVLWRSREELSRCRSRLRSPQVMAAVDDFLAGRCWPLDAIHDLGESRSREKGSTADP